MGAKGLAGRNDAMKLRAEAFDRCPHLVARPQINLRITSHADARRGSGQDDVAWLEAHELAGIRDQLRYRENHIPGRSVLASNLIDAQPQPEPMRIGNLVLRDQPRSERRETIRALALEALAAALELKISLGKINADTISGNVLHCLRLVDVHPAHSNHHTKLDLPIHALGPARDDEHIARTGE